MLEAAIPILDDGIVGLDARIIELDAVAKPELGITTIELEAAKAELEGGLELDEAPIDD